MKLLKQLLFFFCLILLGCVSNSWAQVKPLPVLKVSANKRFLVTDQNKPFFWLGDTGWLLFIKLNRAEIIQYLNDRSKKGFNVIQVMLLHEMKNDVNIYGDSALINKKVSQPKITAGNSFRDSTQYDFWDHVDFVVDEAAKRGIYLAMVPIWGSNVKDGLVTEKEAIVYAQFLSARFKEKTNIIWLNGGDIKGSVGENIWQIMGSTLKSTDQKHLMTFHPRGRSSSSEWYENARWLDFNMFQSGHKDYAQDTAAPKFAEDNYKYTAIDYTLKTTKPTIDGEPSYEHIPHGLHDSLAPIWYAADIRRYGYWSVFAGCFGYTYGHNAVMQFHNGIGIGDFNCQQNWLDAIQDSGSVQMKHLKNLMLSVPYLERIPDQSMVLNQGTRYNYLAATRGKDYALIYTYNGRNALIDLSKISGDWIEASWFNPRNGQTTLIGKIKNTKLQEFNPPGEPKDGNDWVLVLKSIPIKK